MDEHYKHELEIVDHSTLLAFCSHCRSTYTGVLAVTVAEKKLLFSSYFLSKIA